MLKLEVGKYYESKDGAVWKITHVQKSKIRQIFISEIIKETEIHSYNYNRSWFNERGQYGRSSYEASHISDLIKEYKPIKTILPLP